MAGKIHNINSHQIGLDSVLLCFMRMRMSNGSVTIVLYEDGNRATSDTYNK